MKNMKEYVENMKKYEGSMKKYEETIWRNKTWLRELTLLLPDPWRERYAYAYADTIPGMAPST